MLSDFRENVVYMIDMSNLHCNATCLNTFNEDSWLWHRRLGHISFDYLSRINNKKMVKVIPCLKFEKDRICDACQLEKQTKSSFKTIKDILTSRTLELIHMDLFDPTKTKSLSEIVLLWSWLMIFLVLLGFVFRTQKSSLFTFSSL